MAKIKLIAIACLAFASTHLHAMKQVPLAVQNSISPGGVHDEPEQQLKDLNNRLFVAVIEGRVDKALLLLQRGADVNFRNIQNRTPLMQAALEGDADMCAMLIEQGAEINAIGRLGYTALTYAASKRHDLVVHVLVTALPPTARPEILRIRACIIECQLALRQSGMILQKDVRKLITRPLLDELIDAQMARIDAMLAHRNTYGENAYMIAKRKGYAEIAELLDPDNLESRKMIRMHIERNIWHILSGDGKRVVAPQGVLEEENSENENGNDNGN